VAQLLLYRALAANPERFAEHAVEIVLEDDRRLRCGYISDDYWVTRELLQAISPKLSEESFARLEEKLIGWAPEWERRAEARRYRGSAELRLLGGLDRERLSEAGQRRMQNATRGKREDVFVKIPGPRRRHLSRSQPTVTVTRLLKGQLAELRPAFPPNGERAQRVYVDRKVLPQGRFAIWRPVRAHRSRVP
jgi:hypothetical protein